MNLTAPHLDSLPLVIKCSIPAASRLASKSRAVPAISAAYAAICVVPGLSQFLPQPEVDRLAPAIAVAGTLRRSAAVLRCCRSHLAEVNGSSSFLEHATTYGKKTAILAVARMLSPPPPSPPLPSSSPPPSLPSSSSFPSPPLPPTPPPPPPSPSLSFLSSPPSLPPPSPSPPSPPPPPPLPSPSPLPFPLPERWSYARFSGEPN